MILEGRSVSRGGITRNPLGAAPSKLVALRAAKSGEPACMASTSLWQIRRKAGTHQAIALVASA